MKKYILSICIISLISGSSFAKSTPAITVEMKSIDTFITEITGIAKQLAPQLPTAMLPSMLGMAIKNPGLVGIERTKPVQLQVFLPEIDENSQNQSPADLEPTISLHIPVLENGKNYLEILGQSITRPIEKDGIIVFTPTAEDALYIKVDNDYAIISDNKEAVQTSKGISSDALLDINGTIRIGINPKALIPIIKSSAEQAQNIMNQQPTTPDMPMDVGKVIKTEANALTAILKQIENAAIGIKINKSSIDISSRVNTIEESTIAKLNKAVKAPSKKYRSLAPANALYSTSGSGLESFDMLIEPCGKFIEEIYSSMGDQFSSIAPALSKMLIEYKDLYAGDYAAGVIPTGKSLGLYEVFELKDIKKAKEVITKQLSTYNDSYGKTMGTTINFSTNRTYKNIEIESMSYNIGDTMMDMPTPKMTKYILNKLKGEIAYTEDSMIYTIGTPETMNTIIDLLTSKTAITPPSVQFKKLIPDLKTTPIQSYSLSLSKLIRTLLLMSPDIDETMLKESSNTGGIAGYATTEGKDIIGLDRISIDEIIAIRNMASIIQSTLTTITTEAQMEMQTTPPATPPIDK